MMVKYDPVSSIVCQTVGWGNTSCLGCEGPFSVNVKAWSSESNIEYLSLSFFCSVF